jgi:probable selenium-dependent hydroxylase accessory protein YqeC
MKPADNLLPLLPTPEDGGVIALVGAGGKTRAMFGLAEELALRGPDVVLTTTTHIFDPRLEPGRLFDQVLFDAGSTDAGMPRTRPWDLLPTHPDRGRRIVLASREEPATGKLRGLEPARIGELDRKGAFILVEADGAKRLPIKAPAGHEPVIPPAAELVLGIVGLDCLGRPMDAETVHRPECFGPLVGCAPGAPIQLEHIAALALSPQGLFKGTPTGVPRVIVLNKADLCRLEPAELLDRLKDSVASCADLLLVCSLRESDPAKRVPAQIQLRDSPAYDHHSSDSGEPSRCR